MTASVVTRKKDTRILSASGWFWHIIALILLGFLLQGAGEATWQFARLMVAGLPVGASDFVMGCYLLVLGTAIVIGCYWAGHRLINNALDHL